jgi:hypothetical protein
MRAQSLRRRERSAKSEKQKHFSVRVYMSLQKRTPTPFKLSDITRAAKGAKAAGLDISRIEIGSDGKIILAQPAASSDDLIAKLK